MSYLIYTRRSTDDPDNQKNSLEYQERMCKDYAAKHKLQIAPASREDIVVDGICICFVQVEYNVHTSAGELHMDIDGMFARHWSRVTSEKVRDTFTKLRKEKRYPHSAPIGYLDLGSDKKEFDPERAPIIKRLFELYDTGEWSLNELSRWAKKQGLTSKPRRRNRSQTEILKGVELEHIKQTSVFLCKSSIERALKNRFYIGEMYHKGDWLQGGHSPLIDCALFERVQKRLKQNCKSIRYMDKPFYSYRDLFRCTCGRVYTPYRKKGHVYYTCKCKKDCTNSQRTVREELMVEGIQTVFDEIYFSEAELVDIQEKAEQGLNQVSTIRDKEIEDLHIRRKRIHKDIDFIKKNKIALLREKTMSSTELNEESGRLIAELEEVDGLLKAQTESEKEMLKYVLTFSELFKRASSLYKEATDTEKRELAHLVFSELTLVHGNVASYKAKEEFELLLNRPKVACGGADGTRTRDLPRDRRTL
tara:strand:- start:5969 stop:7396 length:1428 start_codon:yes stop_codon:yes gene_type:complete